MRKGVFTICSVLLVLVVSLAVLFPGCDGGGDGGQYTIKVSATLCGTEWEGDLTYRLTCDGEDDIYGYTVPASHFVALGNWSIDFIEGGPPGAFLVGNESDLSWPHPELPFEKYQDAIIVFSNWTIDGAPIEGPTEVVGTCQVIDVHFLQGVLGCLGYNVTLNETSWLNITQTAGPAATIVVVNDDCAVNKTPETLGDIIWPIVNATPPVKLNQVPSINNLTAEAGSNMTLVLNQTTLLDVHTQWQLVKGALYTKSINWLGISKAISFPPGHPCILFELVFPAAGIYSFTLQASAQVALVNATDVDPTYDWATSTPLYLTVNVGPGP
jgi:hypothetical protein